MDETLLDDIIEGLMREVLGFTRHLEACVEEGNIREDDIENPALVRDMFREYLV